MSYYSYPNINQISPLPTPLPQTKTHTITPIPGPIIRHGIPGTDGRIWTSKCGHIRSESNYPWDLMSGIQSSSPAFFKTPVTYIDSIHPNNHEKNEESRNEIQISTNCILLPWPMYTKHSATRGRFGTQS